MKLLAVVHKTPRRFFTEYHDFVSGQLEFAKRIEFSQLL